MNKKEYNKRIVGKVVTVLDPKTGSEWSGTVVRVVSEETVTVKESRTSREKEVDLFDIQNTY